MNRGLDVLTWLVLAVMLAPVVWLLISSLQDDRAAGDRRLRPAASRRSTRSPTMWETVDFERYFLNSLIICTGAALLATAFASSAGYALARFQFRGSRGVRR